MRRQKSTAPLRALLADLTPASPREAIASISELLADLVESRTHPDMAIGALFRHNAPNTLDRSVLETVREEALALLDQRRATGTQLAAAAQIDERDGGWLFTWEAAPRLRVQEKTLRERLAKWEQRQSLGWPVWDGHQWRIPAWAVDSTRSAALLATLPAREPLPHLLPEWCERQA